MDILSSFLRSWDGIAFQNDEDHELMDSRELNVPLGQPAIRQWELNDNSTRYDRLEAAPSDHDLFIMWSLWVVISGLIGIFIGTVMLSILLDAKARKNPFNLYLFYLMVPDFIFSACCALTCLLNALEGSFWSVFMCQFQSFYLSFGVSANNWLNWVIAVELHRLLRSSHIRKKYNAPTRLTVTLQAILVYLYASFVSSWGVWGHLVPWLPHKVCRNVLQNNRAQRFGHLLQVAFQRAARKCHIYHLLCSSL